SIAEGRSVGFRKHWLGTHFFNPPRYLHLLELIPTAETDPQVVADVTAFADRRLGKGVVVAKDAPGFIANRIGMFGLMQIFRALDIAGVDVLAHVARTLAARLDGPDDRAQFALPPFVEQMVARGMVGAKSGRGFYQKAGDEILTLDPKTLEYRAKQSAKLPSLEAARSIEPVADRIRALYNGKDKAGAFLRATLAPTPEYAERIAGEVAHSPADIDNAMKWGFG